MISTGGGAALSSERIDQSEEIGKSATRNRDQGAVVENGHVPFGPIEGLEVGQVDDVRLVHTEEGLWVEVRFEYPDVLAAHRPLSIHKVYRRITVVRLQIQDLIVLQQYEALSPWDRQA